MAAKADLQLLLALEVLDQVLEVDVRHLAEERQQARHVLALSNGRPAGTHVSQSQGTEDHCEAITVCVQHTG